MLKLPVEAKVNPVTRKAFVLLDVASRPPGCVMEMIGSADSRALQRDIAIDEVHVAPGPGARRTHDGVSVSRRAQCVPDLGFRARAEIRRSRPSPSFGAERNQYHQTPNVKCFHMVRLRL